MKDKCPLCAPVEKRTNWYFEDNICWVADCESCGIPMVVLKRHETLPEIYEQVHMNNITRLLFGEKRKIRSTMKKIKNHYHFHVEKK